MPPFFSGDQIYLASIQLLYIKIEGTKSNIPVLEQGVTVTSLRKFKVCHFSIPQRLSLGLRPRKKEKRSSIKTI